MKPVLPVSAKPYAFAAAQALMTTGVSTFIASSANPVRWLTSWVVAWALLVPLVLFMAPVIWRVVNWLSINEIVD